MKINNDIKDLTVIEKDSSEEEIVKILHEFCVDINEEYEITSIKHYRHDMLLMLNANAQRGEFYSFVKNILDLLENDYIASNGKPVDIDNAINSLIDNLLFWHITRRKIKKDSELDNDFISYFNLNYRNVFPFEFFYEQDDEFISNNFSIHLEDLRCGKLVPINTDQCMAITIHEFRVYIGYKYKVDDQAICELCFEFILNGDLEVSYKDFESDGLDSHINTIPKDQGEAIDKLQEQIKSGHAKLSTFHGQSHSLSNNEDKSVHFYIYDDDKKREIGDVTLKYKNGYAYLKYDEYELNTLLNSIYEGDIQRLIGIINSKPELVNTSLIKQNVRSGAIEIITYPLIEAILSNQMDMVEILLGEGKASINAVTSAGITPLYATMLMGHKTLSYHLIAKGAKLTNEYKHSVLDNIPVRELFSTYHFQEHILTLYDAIEKQDIDFIKKYLIDEGRSGHLPFILPEEEAHLEVAYYPIIAAIRTGNLDIIKLLVEEGGADVNVSNWFDHLEDSNSKNTGQALHEAVSLRYEDIPTNRVVSIINYLIDRGANVNAIVGFGWMPLTSAVTQTIIEGKNNIYDFSIIDLLLERGADIDFEVPLHMLSDISQGTALGEAICANDITVVKYLLDKGAKTCTKDPNLSPMEVSRFPDDSYNPVSQEIINLLKERGAK